MLSKTPIIVTLIVITAQSSSPTMTVAAVIAPGASTLVLAARGL